MQSLGVAGWPIWEHDVGAFDYVHEADEDCYFLQGRVVVTPKGVSRIDACGCMHALVHGLCAGARAC